MMGITASPGTSVNFYGYLSTAEILNPAIYQNSGSEGIEARDSHRCCKAGQDLGPESGDPALFLSDFFRFYIRVRHLQEPFGALLSH